MFVKVNGVRLYFDVEGAKLLPDGAKMREKPTLLLLHGGPGFDHSSYKPAFSRFADVAQVVYLDEKGKSVGQINLDVNPASFTVVVPDSVAEAQLRFVCAAKPGAKP